MERKSPEHKGTREKMRERERENAQEMEAKIEARKNQAAMKDSAIQDTKAETSKRILVISPWGKKELRFFR